jgi:ArsR family transcriptional regulator, arsenate/arsenite/antimonite-responsive transcriptional repressor
MDKEQFARIAKALADPRRFEILETIAGGEEVPCKHLVESFPISQATISHHLKELATAGLIEVRREAQCCHYRSRPEVIAEYLEEAGRRLATEAEASAR